MIQSQGPADNSMSCLAQGGGLEHPQNGNVGMGSELMRVSIKRRGYGFLRQSTHPLGFTNNYVSWLYGTPIVWKFCDRI